jgi:hypothetical protein
MFLDVMPEKRNRVRSRSLFGREMIQQGFAFGVAQRRAEIAFAHHPVHDAGPSVPVVFGPLDSASLMASDAAALQNGAAIRGMKASDSRTERQNARHRQAQGRQDDSFQDDSFQADPPRGSCGSRGFRRDANGTEPRSGSPIAERREVFLDCLLSSCGFVKDRLRADGSIGAPRAEQSRGCLRQPSVP